MLKSEVLADLLFVGISRMLRPRPNYGILFILKKRVVAGEIEPLRAAEYASKTIFSSSLVRCVRPPVCAALLRTIHASLRVVSRKKLRS